MPAVFVFNGQLECLQTLLDNLPVNCFPYKNDRTPRQGDHVGLYTEADFSGYDGRKALGGWSAALILDGRAYSLSAAVGWHHNGGPIDNNIYGVCVVSLAGDLIWAERDPRAPVLVRPANPDYSYTGTWTEAAEFVGPA